MKLSTPPGFQRRRPPAPPRKPQPNWLRMQLMKFQERRRFERLRPKANPQPSALQRWILASWRSFTLKRRQQRSTAPGWSLQTLLNPGGSKSISPLRATVVAMRSASVVLVQLTLIPLVLNAIPVRLSGPEWYLQLINAMGESAPLWILACLIGLASLSIGDPDPESLAYHRRLARFSRLLSLIVVALIPLQIGFVVWLYGGAFDMDRTQLNAIRSQSQALITAVQQQTTKEQFVTFLRSSNITANLAAIEASPFIDVMSAFIQRVELDRDRQEQTLKAATRSNLVKYSTNTVKLLATLVVFSGFMLAFHSWARRSLLLRLQLETSELQKDPSIEISAP